MDGGIVHNDNGFFLDRFAENIHTRDHDISRDRLFKHVGIQIIISVHKAKDIHASTFSRRNFDDCAFFLPGIGNTWGV